MTTELVADNFDLAQLRGKELERVAELEAGIRGYSDLRHYVFFRSVMATRPIHKVLMLGVYFGRDIAFLLAAAHRTGHVLDITGVDKFSNDSCADWPELRRHQTWEMAGLGPAPTLEAAAANLAPLASPSHVRLVRGMDHLFLRDCRELYDLIYLDTSHDEATVLRQLEQVRPLLAPGGLVAGDDYADHGSWGVAKALRKVAPRHLVLNDSVWVIADTALHAGHADAVAA